MTQTRMAGGLFGPLESGKVRKIRLLRERDGMTHQAVADALGVSYKTVRKYAPGRPGKIPNDQLRAAFIASGLTAAEVARRLGWFTSKGADVSRVRRSLGLQADVTTTGPGVTYRGIRRLIDAETAGLIAEAIGVGPWEVGA